MNFFEYSSTSPSTRCSSRPVPSVTVISACVSPRWNTAEPCTRGSRSTSHSIGRSVLPSRPSGRVPARIRSRTTLLFQVVPGVAERVRGDRALGVRVGNHLALSAASFNAEHGFGPGLLARGLLGRLKRVVVLPLERVEQAVGRAESRTAVFSTSDLLDQLQLQIADLANVVVGLR